MPSHDPVPVGIPFKDIPVELQNAILAKCNSQACKDAQNQVIASRNNVITACSDSKRFESDRTFFAALAAAFVAAAVVAWVAFAKLPFPWNLVVFIIAVVLTIAAIVASGYAADFALKVAQANARRATAEQMFKDAVAAVMQNCDGYCYGDLTVAPCP